MKSFNSLAFILLGILSATGMVLYLFFYSTTSVFPYRLLSLARVTHSAAAITLFLLAFIAIFRIYWIQIRKTQLILALILFFGILLNMHLGLSFEWGLLAHQSIGFLSEVRHIDVPKDAMSYEIQTVNGIVYYPASEMVKLAAHSILIPSILILILYVRKRSNH